MTKRRAHGVDISAWQKTFNPPDAIKEEIDFVVLKASQGITRDGKFESFYSTASEFPIQGAYHYYTTTSMKTSKLLPESGFRKRELKDSPKVTIINNGTSITVPKVRIQSISNTGVGWQEQADFFIKTVKDKDFQFLALDIEEGPNPSKWIGFSRNIFKKADVLNMVEWIKYVKEQTGKPVLLYTRALILRDKLIPNGGEELKNMDMWIAWYADGIDRENDSPYKKYTIPDVSNWRLWQYSADKNNKGSEFGVETSGIDLDVFNGTIDEMKAWLAGEAIEPIVTEVAEPQVEGPGVAEPEVSKHVEQPMEWIITQVEKLIAAGITPSVEINIEGTLIDLDKLKALKETLEKAGFTPEVNLSLDISSKSTLPLRPSITDSNQKKGIDSPPNQDFPTSIPHESFSVMASPTKKDKAHIPLYIVNGEDGKGKPIMGKPNPIMRITKGEKFSVSSTHKVGKKDKGNGKIIASGDVIYYFITDYPRNKDAVGKFVFKDDVKRV
jgi:GH25 family lysozyme M1 (1,4-beta-N-acetylmuramidase)